MSKEKQIEEMARFIVENTDLSVFDIAENIAQELYNAGYRKQSEGEWENVYEYNEYLMHRERKTACSVCGYKPKGDICAKTPFCPNCGARMKGENNEN